MAENVLLDERANQHQQRHHEPDRDLLHERLEPGLVGGGLHRSAEGHEHRGEDEHRHDGQGHHEGREPGPRGKDTEISDRNMPRCGQG